MQTIYRKFNLNSFNSFEDERVGGQAHQPPLLTNFVQKSHEDCRIHCRGMAVIRIYNYYLTKLKEHCYICIIDSVYNQYVSAVNNVTASQEHRIREN
jgi:hypothetical protein